MAKFLNNIDLTKNEIQNAKLQNLGSDPSPAAGDKGLLHFNTTTSLAKVWNGSTFDTISNLLESVAGSGAISVTGVVGKAQTISIVAATGAVPGTMSAAHYSLVAGATNINTASTIVMRDGSGNFSAGTISAALTGTASNASQLNNQAAAFYLARGNHTGTQLASTVSDFDTQVRTSRLDQLAAPTTAVNLNSQKITGLATPTSATDAVNKSYVDGVVQGLDVKPSVRVASTANIATTYTATAGVSGRGQHTLAPNTIDGLSLAAGDRILLKDQTVGAQNGIWIVSTLGTGANGVWDRGPSFDSDAEVTPGAFVFVEDGTSNADTGWVLTTNAPIILGGASGSTLIFTQFSGAGSVIAGNGLARVGNTLSVTGTSNRISVSGAGVDIAATYVGQSSITTVGTIAAGTWQGTMVGLAYGGTGATTAAGAKTTLGFKTSFPQTIGDGVATTYTVTHNMGTKDVLVSVQDATTGDEVFPNVTRNGINTVQVVFSVAPATNAYRVVVVG